jgi:hypothetical protein
VPVARHEDASDEAPAGHPLDLVAAFLGAGATGAAWRLPAPRALLVTAGVTLAGVTGWRAVRGPRASLGLLLLAAACAAMALAAAVDEWFAKDFPTLAGTVVPWIAIAGPLGAAWAATGELFVAARASRRGLAVAAGLAALFSLAAAVLGFVTRVSFG